MQKVGQGLRFGSEILGELRDMRNRQKLENPDQAQKSSDQQSFFDHLKSAIEEVNQTQISADKKATDLTSGKDTNIHDTMLAATQAELNFNLMVQVRNKALEAYQEIMRMPI